MKMKINEIYNKIQEVENEILDEDEDAQWVSYDDTEFRDLRQMIVTPPWNRIKYEFGEYTGESLYGLIPFGQGQFRYHNGITIEHQNYAPEYLSKHNPVSLNQEEEGFFSAVVFDLYGAEDSGSEFFFGTDVGDSFHNGVEELFTSFPYGYPKFPEMQFDKIIMPDGTTYRDVGFSVDGESGSYYKVSHGRGYQVSGFSDFGAIGLGYPAEDYMIDELKAIVRDRRAYGEYHCGALEGYADTPNNYLKGHIMFRNRDIFSGYFLCPDNGQFLEDKKVIETVILKGDHLSHLYPCRSNPKWRKVNFSKSGKKKILRNETLQTVELRRTNEWGEECIVFEDELAA